MERGSKLPLCGRGGEGALCVVKAEGLLPKDYCANVQKVLKLDIIILSNDVAKLDLKLI